MDLLRLNKKKAMMYVKNLCNKLCNQADNKLPYILHTDMLVGNSCISDSVNGDLSIHVGLDGLEEKHKFHTTVSDLNYTRCIIGIFHEYRHSRHFLESYHDMSDKNIYLATNHLACQNNHSYYCENRNYPVNPREIDVERYAVFDAYSYLSNQFPDVDCESLILKYVNFRVDVSDYFIKPSGKKFTSLEEVNVAFDKAFEDSKTAKRTCYTRSKSDEVSSLLHDSEWNQLFTRFWDDDITGIEQDKMVAAIELHLHPEYKGFHTVLNDVDLSPETVFGRTFPEIPEAVKQQVEKNRRWHDTQSSYTISTMDSIYERRMQDLYEAFPDFLQDEIMSLENLEFE